MMSEFVNERAHHTHTHTHTFFGQEACRILVPQQGIGPVPPAVEEQGLNHWTTREVPSKQNDIRSWTLEDNSDELRKLSSWRDLSKMKWPLPRPAVSRLLALQ